MTTALVPQAQISPSNRLSIAERRRVVALCPEHLFSTDASALQSVWALDLADQL